MKFILKRKSKNFIDRFRIKEKAVVISRKTFLSKIGLGRGYKTRIKTDPEISESGDLESFVELLKDAGDINPLGMPAEIPEGYNLIIQGRLKEFLDDSTFIDFFKGIYEDGESIGFDDLQSIRRRFGHKRITVHYSPEKGYY